LFAIYDNTDHRSFFVNFFDPGQRKDSSSAYFFGMNENATATAPDKSMMITACRGSVGDCRFALPLPGDLAARLENMALKAGWPAFLGSRLGDRIHAHQALRVGISACANACAKPQIKDFGLIASRRPRIIESACMGCGLCQEACPDGAVSMQDGLARIDPGACLSCGRCEKACPEGAITALQEGYRVLVGGRLGRRPKLAAELPGLYGVEQALAVFEQMLLLIMGRYRPDRRYSELFQPSELLPVQA
jgi:dissimilatory sulfite reductase (desulfoviridin) alpha/beta subunit